MGKDAHRINALKWVHNTTLPVVAPYVVIYGVILILV